MSVKIIKQPHYEWIDLLNPEKEELEKIAKDCNLNYYNLADSLEPNHLPKVEVQGDFNFIIVRKLNDQAKKNNISIEGLTNKIAIFYNSTTIITIHRVEIGFLNDIAEMYVNQKKTPNTTSIIIKILWSVINTYSVPIMNIFTHLDGFEDQLFLKHAPKNMLQKIYLLKKQVNLSRKILYLSEDIIESVKPSKQESAAYNDLKDLFVKITTFHDQVNDNLNNLLNIYISLSSQKTNEIMKTLTIFSIFFMPLTFIAGIYGMNFRIMPELELTWGYPLTLLMMGVITVFIYFWLKRKKWL